LLLIINDNNNNYSRNTTNNAKNNAYDLYNYGITNVRVKVGAAATDSQKCSCTKETALPRCIATEILWKS